MFGYSRFNLSRFSAGSQASTIISVEMTLLDELKQVSGAAIPVETTAFFNDVVRGTQRGAIAVRSEFESGALLQANCSMNANINISFLSENTVIGDVDGSQNKNLMTTFAEYLRCNVHGSKVIPYALQLNDVLYANVDGFKNIQALHTLSDVFTSILEATTQRTEIVRIDVELPPGGEIRIDSETYRVLLNGENILHMQSGDWLRLSRELLYMDIESATGGSLDGTIIYTERYL